MTDVKPVSLVIAAVAFIIGAAIALAVIRGFSVGDPSLAFVVGAILGAQAGAIAHSRHPEAEATVAVKLGLGAVLAGVALIFGFVVHFAISPFKYPDVTLAIAAIGSFIFPFAIFNTMFNATRRSQSPES
ncbi:MAG: hypothetical protein P8K78_09400 [Pirellulales bacterium]|nr:hypothetical protein [Pirellulales bacterium]